MAERAVLTRYYIVITNYALAQSSTDNMHSCFFKERDRPVYRQLQTRLSWFLAAVMGPT